MKTWILLALIYMVPMKIYSQVPADNQRASFEKLDAEIKSRVMEADKKMPESVRKEVMNSKQSATLFDVSAKSQNWVSTQIMVMSDEELVRAFEMVQKSLKQNGKTITAHDYAPVLHNALIAQVKGDAYDLVQEINSIVAYWRENSKPSIERSPDGLGKISWLWTLEVKSRLHGILHVGLDVEKRTFICYENSVGLYFPEGEVLERIYREIVQDELMAGEHIGKGKKSIVGGGQSPPPSDPNPFE